MTLARLIPLAAHVSLFLVVFALGLATRGGEATYLFRRPGLLARSITAMNVAMPLCVVVAVLLVDLPPPIEIALIALAASPVPPILPARQEKAGGTEPFVIGLLVAASVWSIVLVPGAIELIGRTLHRDVHMPFTKVAPVVLVSILLPLAAGMLVRRVKPQLAARVARPLSLGATALLVLVALPALAASWPAVRALIGQGLVTVLVLFSLVGLLVGHLLGGPDPDDRTALALATATRHPGMAIAIAGLNFPDARGASAVVLFHLVVGVIASLPYVGGRKRRHASRAAT